VIDRESERPQHLRQTTVFTSSAGTRLDEMTELLWDVAGYWVFFWHCMTFVFNRPTYESRRSYS